MTLEKSGFLSAMLDLLVAPENVCPARAPAIRYSLVRLCPRSHPACSAPKRSGILSPLVRLFWSTYLQLGNDRGLQKRLPRRMPLYVPPGGGGGRAIRA